MRTARLALALLSIAAIAPMTVGAAIPRPIQLSPKSGAKLPAGKTPLFKVRSTGSGTVWVHVSRSARKDSEGIIGSDALIVQARKKSGSTFQVKPKFFNYPGFWANTKRKWYWQSYRIACGEEEGDDCKIESKVRAFTLR